MHSNVGIHTGSNFNSSGNLRAGKGTLYEGGTRVPMIARWPGTIPPGQIIRETAGSVDNLAKLAQGECDAAIVQQGQVGNGLYIVVSGGVSIVAGSDELARLGPGKLGLKGGDRGDGVGPEVPLFPEGLGNEPLAGP